MVPLTVHLLKYCDSIHCGFLVLANAIFASLLHPCWLKDVPGALLWEDLNSTLKQFIHLMHKKKSMPVPIIISNWQCWKLLFCPCIVIVIYWACSLCVPAIIYIQWLCLPGGKNYLYELERCHSCKLLLQSCDRQWKLFIMDIHVWMLWLLGALRQLHWCCSGINRQAMQRITETVCKIGFRMKMSLSAILYVPWYILFHLEVQCMQLSIFTICF